MTTHTDVEPLIEESIEVAAPPAAVWKVVSDLPRIAEWSPQVVRSIVRGRPIALGSEMFNLNRHGKLLFWPTRAKVVRFEPHSEIAFRIKENFTIWSFTLEPTETGTRVVHRREAPNGTSSISNTLVDRVFGGQSTFQSDLRAGMATTLAGVKDAVES